MTYEFSAHTKVISYPPVNSAYTGEMFATLYGVKRITALTLLWKSTKIAFSISFNTLYLVFCLLLICHSCYFLMGYIFHLCPYFRYILCKEHMP